MRNFIARHKLAAAMGSQQTLAQALLQILPTGPSASIMASGALTTGATGVGGTVVSCSRAASAYCLNSSGQLVLLGPNHIRVEPNGILVEGASSNLVLQSNTLSNAAWTLDGSTVTQNVTGPDGVASGAWTMADGVALGNHRIFMATSFTAGGSSQSIYAKAGTVNFIGLSGNNGSTAVWNVSAGTVSSSSGGTASIVALGSGWFRCVLITTAVSAANTIITMGDTAAHALGPNNTYTGANNTILVWNPQAELQAFASSPMISGASAATRDADVVTVANPLTLGGNFAAAATFVPNPGGFSAFTGILAGGTAAAPNTWRLLLNALGSTQEVDVWDNSAVIKSTSNSAVISLASHRYATAVTAGVSALWLDGSVVTPTVTGTGANVLASQPATIYLGQLSTGFQGNGWLTRVYADPSLANVPLL